MLNFNLVSETQPKMNIRTYLFVLKSSFECISRKKKGSSEIRFETISYSHLASKFSFWRTPISNFGPAKTPMSALDQNFQRRRLNDLTVFEASLHFRHVLTYRLKQTTRQKDAKQQENLLLQYSNQL